MSATREVMVRKVLESCPDGHGVVRVETITVTVEWPGQKPIGHKAGDTFTQYGSWELVDSDWDAATQLEPSGAGTRTESSPETKGTDRKGQK